MNVYDTERQPRFLGIAYGRIQAAQSPLEIRFPSTVELEMQCE